MFQSATRWIWLLVFVGLSADGSITQAQSQEPGGSQAEPSPDSIQAPRQPSKVTRAKRPIFTERDWDGIYFENLFRDGLVGSRPSADASPSTAKINSKPAEESNSADSGNASQGWAQVIAAEVIENEIKRLQLQLDQDITTPAKFKTDYVKVRQTFSLLSMWFAIIHEYPEQVRWKQFAASVQPACWRTAAAARTDSEQAFQNARLRKEELQEMIRGGAFTDSEKPIEAVDWSQVVDRVPTMTCLESVLNELKAMTASSNEFKSKTEDVAIRAGIIAAIGRVLAQEAMEGGDDEDYRKLAHNMTQGAQSLMDACKLNDADSAAKAVNLVEQSCNKCHEDWR